MAARKASMALTQKQWENWAQQRIADAPRIAKLYERQGKAVQDLLHERGCPCNPVVVFAQGENGGPSTKDPYFTHAFDCDRRD